MLKISKLMISSFIIDKIQHNPFDLCTKFSSYCSKNNTMTTIWNYYNMQQLNIYVSVKVEWDKLTDDFIKCQRIISNFVCYYNTNDNYIIQISNHLFNLYYQLSVINYKFSLTFWKRIFFFFLSFKMSSRT